MKKLLILFCLLGIYSVQAQLPHMSCHYHHLNDEEPREHSLNIERQELHVSFVPKDGRVNGKVTHYFRVLQQRVDTLFFDAPGIQIKSATLNGQPVRFTTSATGVTLHPDKPLTWEEQNGRITFEYTCTPRKGIYFIGWNDPKGLHKKQIWTQGQGIDNRYWIPSYDFGNDKMITENHVTFESKYQVLSNGTLVSQKENGNGTTTWHYRMTHRHPNYLLMLGIGEYKIMETKTRNGLPVRLWYYPEHEDRKETIYRYSVESIEFMEKHLGIAFPWESYSQIPVADFMYGAMENTTATLFGDFFCGNKRDSLDRNYINVNVHELTHQWFGDLITGRSSKEGWLQESFATFYPKLFTREVYGEDAYQWQRRGEHNSALHAAKTDNHPIRSLSGGTTRWYPKGSAVLDMMLHTFGEDAYRRVIYHYLKKHAYANVETNDLYQAFQDTLGLSPHWFFDQWVYRGGEPHYRVSYEDEQVDGKRYTEILVEQIHEQHALIGPFKMPIDIEVHYTDGSRDHQRVWIEKAYHILNLPNPGNKTIDFVLFDPGSHVLKQVTFRKPFRELEAQALKAPLMIDRYDAVAALDTVPADRKRTLLAQVFAREKFHAVPAEIVRQLANDPHAESQALIRKALQHPDVNVRKACVQHIRHIPEALRPGYESLLADSSYDVIREVLKKLCADYPAHARRYLQQTASQQGSVGKRLEIDWLTLSAQSGDGKSLALLVAYAGPSYEFRTRISAIQALTDLNYVDNTLLQNLSDAALSPNTRLAGPAQDALKYYLGKTAYRAQVLAFYRSRNWQPWEKEILKPVFEK
ncbi:MAG: hypothetical protein KF690_04025 [Bacteroidetes bacterium]|nr:hypothetical protein [Bacteroidota bacterium]